jgi:hypothetical protein
VKRKAAAKKRKAGDAGAEEEPKKPKMWWEAELEAQAYDADDDVAYYREEVPSLRKLTTRQVFGGACRRVSLLVSLDGPIGSLWRPFLCIWFSI